MNRRGIVFALLVSVRLRPHECGCGTREVHEGMESDERRGHGRVLLQYQPSIWPVGRFR
jgi:hypothetical protein